MRGSAATRSLRILIVVPYDISEPGGGVKHHALGLARVLRRLGDTAIVAGPSSAPVREPYMVGFPGVVDVRCNGSGNRIGIGINPLVVRRFLRHNRFDIIHVHDPLVPALPYYVAWFSPGVPKICTFHAFAENRSFGMWFGHHLGAALIARLFQRGIAVSRPAESLVQPVWRRPLAIIPNGVPTDLFTPRAGFEDACPVGTQNPLRLFFCARLSDERKGFMDLLRAYAMLRDRRVPVTLDVAGEAGGIWPPELPGLTYHGPVSLRKLIACLQQCDVLVAPSTGQESFGIVLLEAMACGRPIICSDIEGYRQAVDTQGACLSPRQSPAALADAIVALAEDPERRQAMAVANRRHALDFDWARLTPYIRSQYLLAIENQPEQPVVVGHALQQARDGCELSPAVPVSAYSATAQ